MASRLSPAIALLALLAFAGAFHAASRYFFMQPEEGQDISSFSAALPAGYEVAGYGGADGFLVRAPVLSGLRTMAASVASGPSEIPMDNSRKLIEGVYDGEGPVEVELFEGEDNAENAQALESLGFAQVQGGLYSADSPSNESITAASELGFVKAVFRNTPIHILNIYSSELTGSISAGVSGYYGEGVTVAIGDTGLDTGNISTVHTDLRPNAVGITAMCVGNPSGADMCGHGTHVSGTIAGRGTVDPAARGVAPKASIFMQSISRGGCNLCSLSDLQRLYSQAADAGATVHSDSWGGSSSYDFQCERTDNYVYEHKDFTIVFAAGNNGPDPGTIESPAISKNVISAGASGTPKSSAFSTDGPDMLAFSGKYFSSRGPTKDGRIKPDVMAPGEHVYSTYSSLGVAPLGRDSYASLSGTSMATPAVAGSVAVMKEYLAKNRSHPSSSSSLIKALLVAGADEMAAYGPTPNYMIGFGRVNLAKSLALDPSYSMQFWDLDAPLSNGQNHTYTFTIPASASYAKIALAWIDPECSRGVNYCNNASLVNNLDLVVRAPNGTFWRGNNRTANSPVADYKNNVEMVALDNPVSGTYTITVRGVSVPIGPQDFSVAVVSVANASTTLTGCADLSLENGTYYFATGIFSDRAGACLSITAPNITLDCRGHILGGAGRGTGVLINSSGARVANCTLERWAIGISAAGPDAGISRNTLRTNGVGAVSNSTGANISSNRIFNSTSYGIFMDASTAVSGVNLIYNNHFENAQNIYSTGGPYGGYAMNASVGAGRNIMGGNLMGGNYWADGAGTGFSENCTDEAAPAGICDSAYSPYPGLSDDAPLKSGSTPGNSSDVISVTLASDEVWTKLPRNTLNISYRLNVSEGISALCSLQNRSGAVLAFAVHNESGNYSLRALQKYSLQGRIQYTISCSVIGGDNSGYGTFSVYYDRTRPSITDFYPRSSNSRYNDTFWLEAEDNLAPNVTCRFNGANRSLDSGRYGSFSAHLAREGTNVLAFSCADTAGNVRSKTFRVLKDTVPPAITVSISNLAGGRVSLRATARDRASNIIRAEMSRDGINFTLSYAYPFSFSRKTASVSAKPAYGEISGAVLGAEDNSSQGGLLLNIAGGNMNASQIGGVNYSSGFPLAWGRAFGISRANYTAWDGTQYPGVSHHEYVYSLDSKSSGAEVRKYLVSGAVTVDTGGVVIEPYMREITVDGNNGSASERMLSGFGMDCGTDCLRLGEVDGSRYTADGGMVAALTFIDVNSTSAKVYSQVAKFSASGTKEWDYNSSEAIFSAVFESPSGDFDVFGYNLSGPGVIAASLDSSGSELSFSSTDPYPGAEYYDVQDVARLSSGGYAVAGSVQQDSSYPFLMALDGSLSGKWAYADLNRSGWYASVAELPDGRLFVAGNGFDNGSTLEEFYGNGTPGNYSVQTAAGDPVSVKILEGGKVLVLYSQYFGDYASGPDYDSEIAMYDRSNESGDWDMDANYVTGGYYLDRLSKISVLGDSDNFMVALAGETNSPSLQIGQDTSTLQIWLAEISPELLGANSTPAISAQPVQKTPAAGPQGAPEPGTIGAAAILRSCMAGGSAPDKCLMSNRERILALFNR
jgi:hypothetical protein